MKTEKISIELLEENNGQIEGLPTNPRFIRDDRFEALKKSIQDAPEMLELRALMVVPYEKESKAKYVVIGGNMRLRACIELGYTEVDAIVLPADTSAEKLREYTIKDNEAFGQTDWECLETYWNEAELKDWGMELLAFHGDKTDIDDFFNKIEEQSQTDKENKITIITPQDYNLNEVKEKIKECLTAFPLVKIR